MAKKDLIIIGIIIILVLLSIVLLVTKVPEQKPAPAEETSITEPEEASEVVTPLFAGKQVFEVITTARTFKIVELEVDPVDVKLGESQQVTIWVEDTEDKPISSENEVEGTAFTDNKTTPFSFELKEVSDANGTTLTTWEGFWVLDDTYDKIYMVSILAKSADDKHKIDLTFK